jgi:hypothetical protein
MQPLEGSHDPLTLIIARFNVDILYQKIMCLLHRKYLSRARQNPRYAHSRRSAIEASLETLRHLVTLHRESQPNGRLRSVKWYVSSIATKEFLLPAMLVVLDLHFDNMAERSGQRQDSQAAFFWTPEQRMEMVSILETARDIWEELADTSMDAVKAYNVVKIMLEKIKDPNASQDSSPPDSIQPKTDLFSSMDSAEMQPEHSAAMTLGMLSGGMTPNTVAAFNSVQSPGGTSYPPIDLGSLPVPEATGTGMTPDYQLDGMGMGNPTSPFSSMFSTMGTGGTDFTQNFDWVG